MARKGLLGKNRPAESELSRVYDEVRDAFEKVAADHDVVSSPVVVAVVSGVIPAGAAIVKFNGGTGQRLTLPPANAQGTNVGTEIVVVNASQVGVEVATSRGDALGGVLGAVATVGAGQLVWFIADGATNWFNT
jgi:hypothetical protein